MVGCQFFHIKLLLTIFVIKGVSSENVLNKDDNNGTSSENDETKGKCRLYLAESSLPDAGMGVYSGIDVTIGNKIGNPVIAVPWFDMPYTKNSMLKRYVWQGFTHGMQEEADNVEVFTPGILSLVNGHQALNNLFLQPSVLFGEAGLHRSRDPGVGAFTPYHNIQVHATKPILAGSELFADYGDDWYTFRDRKNKFKHVPSWIDYDMSTEVLHNFAHFMKIHSKDISQKEFEFFWNFYRDEYSKSENAYNLLPKSANDIKYVADIGLAMYNAPENFIRPLKWLEENGICIDNIEVRPSKLAQAGRGAFSTLFVEKGSVLTSSPVLHECEAESFLHENTDMIQLMLNYGYSHKSSSVVLLPYGPHVSVINHSSEKPNVRIRWSTSRFHNKDWLNMSISELCEKKNAEMMWDYIALVDINPGDEILMDYGLDWSNAWREHVENWIPPRYSEYFQSASYFNELKTPIKTLKEQKLDPYPTNVFTECLCLVSEDETRKMFDFVPLQNYQFLYPCDISSRRTINGTDLYYAHVYLLDDDEEEEFKALVKDIPRSGIRFNVAPYTTDMHLEQAFRHVIGIPDDMIPTKWKDKHNV